MRDWFTQLKSAVEAAGHTTRTWDAGDGQLLVMDHGARLLACRMPGVAGNLFWHNPQLEDPARAGGPLAEAGGAIGGDRLWIAPEVAYMWPSLEDARRDPVGTCKLPDAIDPAEWGALEQGPARVVLATDMNLTDHRSGRVISLNVTRELAAAGPPATLPDDVRCASFAIRNDLALIEGDEGAVASTWDLLQLPPRGTLICPTVSPVETPRSYYEPFGDEHVQCDERRVRFLIDSKRRIKMGLLAERVTGRMGYYRQLDDGGASLILRIFTPLPGEPYVDLPRASDETFGGDALQAYNDDGTAVAGTGFGEMESIDPALVVGRGPTIRTGVSITHVLVGPDAAVRAAGEQLLGVPVDPIV